jgi:steroid delta-isomerase-like uncharacterized protein
MKAPLGILVSLILTTSVLLTPTGQALAQGCTDELVQDYLAGWSNDLPKLLPLFTDDVFHEDKAVGAAIHGKEEYRGFAEGWFKAVPDLRLTPTSSFVSGNRAFVEWVATGTQKGDMPGMPASNKFFSVPGTSLMECQDGKLKHITEYWDMATVMRQLGFLPAPK